MDLWSAQLDHKNILISYWAYLNFQNIGSGNKMIPCWCSGLQVVRVVIYASMNLVKLPEV